MTGPLGRAALLLRTARHLRARQLAHQVLRLVRGPTRVVGDDLTWNRTRASVVTATLAGLGPVAGAEHADAIARAWLKERVDGLGLSIPWTGDWRTLGPSPLWRYHLLYHDHLADVAWHVDQQRDANGAARLSHDLRRWFRAWSDGDLPAWDAYPVSVRLVNWLRILGWVGDRLDTDVVTALQGGIALQVAHLRRNIEWHLDGNHLLRDSWALVLGTAVIDGPDAPRWRSEARTLFDRTMREQVLADGWHEERSPMYHVRALRDAIEVERVLAALMEPLSPDVAGRIAQMAGVVPWMERADGTLWSLNDTAGDHGVALDSMIGHAAGPIAPQGVRSFESAHTLVAVDPSCGDRLRIDTGAPAPSHQPGHAHAGALGFELDLGGIPFVVDGGCSGYDGDPWRPYLRGTASHSTIVVDGVDQSELWATFRLGSRATVGARPAVGDARSLTVSAACRPYHARRVEHRREFRRVGREVRIADVVQGAATRRIESYLHFDPRWSLHQESAGLFIARFEGSRVRIVVDGPPECSLHRGERSPDIGWRARGFNDVVASWTLRMRESRYVERPWTMTITPD